MVTDLISDNESFPATSISQHVWETRYQWMDGDVIHDQCIEDTGGDLFYGVVLAKIKRARLDQSRIIGLSRSF